MGNFNNVEEAKAVCAQDDNCLAVYNSKCNGLAVDIALCPKNITSHNIISPSNTESCVYTTGTL